MITYFFIAPKKPFWAQSILRLRLFLPKAAGWQNGSNGWNGWERIFIPPEATGNNTIWLSTIMIFSVLLISCGVLKIRVLSALSGWSGTFGGGL